MPLSAKEEIEEQEILAELRTNQMKFISQESDLKKLKRTKEETDLEVGRLTRQKTSIDILILDKLRQSKDLENKVRYLEEQTYRLKKKMINLRSDRRKMKHG